VCTHVADGIQPLTGVARLCTTSNAVTGTADVDHSNCSCAAAAYPCKRSAMAMFIIHLLIGLQVACTDTPANKHKRKS